MILAQLTANYALGNAQNCQQGYQAVDGYNVPAPPSRLSTLANHLDAFNAELNGTVERAARLADRLMGSIPQEVSKGDGSIRGGGGGLASLIEGYLERSDMLLTHLRNALDRLETL